MLNVSLVILGLIFVAMTPNVLAEEYNVSIVDGNIDPVCIETQCYDPTVITINTGDTIVWNNADIPAHTIVSGSAFEGQDGTFDSGLILPEKTFTHTFVNAGDYPYYCVLHPWAEGIVRVTGEPITETTIDEESGEEIVTVIPPIQVPEIDDTRKVQVIGFIGQKVGDGTSYTMSYISTGEIETSFVNQENSFILFTFSTPAPEGDEIIMKLHQDMIVNPNFVEVNGVPITEYNFGKQNEHNVLIFKAPVETWEIKVYGTQVVPEFGTVAMMVLAIGVIAVIVMFSKSSLAIKSGIFSRNY